MGNNSLYILHFNYFETMLIEAAVMLLPESSWALRKWPCVHMVEEAHSQVDFASLVPRQTRLWDQMESTTTHLSVVQWDVQGSSWTGGASGLTWQIFSPAHAEHSESEGLWVLCKVKKNMEMEERSLAFLIQRFIPYFQKFI